EVVPDHRGIDSRGRGDVAHRGLVVSGVGEHPARDRQDHVAGVRLTARSSDPGHGAEILQSLTFSRHGVSVVQKIPRVRSFEMPAPRWVARANKMGLNRLTKFVAPWAPGWAVVIHRGRRSGRTFRTPLWAFRRGNGYVIA